MISEPDRLDQLNRHFVELNRQRVAVERALKGAALVLTEAAYCWDERSRMQDLLLTAADNCRDALV
jgi:hypothetical protein